MFGGGGSRANRQQVQRYAPDGDEIIEAHRSVTSEAATLITNIGTPFILKAAKLALESIAAIGIGSAYAIDKLAQSAAEKGRRAAGYGGTNVGLMTAEDIGFERYYDPKSVMAGMAQAKFDITSPLAWRYKQDWG